MRAVLITRPGGVDVLEMGDVATPHTGPNQILVRVHATAVNRADIMQRRGNYPAPAGVHPDIPGLEYAGEVVDASNGDGRWAIGDRVMGLVSGASYAEYIVTHEDEALPVPASLSYAEAAAVPEAFLTAHDALSARLGMREDETILIHAVASGVGTAASQLAKRMGCRVFGTARSAWKLERVREYGVDVAIDVAAQNFVDVVKAETNGHGVDAIADLVGGSYLTPNVQALAQLGRIVVIGLVAGARSELDMRLLLNKRATIVGTVLRARSPGEKIEVARAFMRDCADWLESGAVRPVIDQVLPMSEVREAHRIVEANENVGKVVLEII